MNNLFVSDWTKQMSNDTLISYRRFGHSMEIEHTGNWFIPQGYFIDDKYPISTFGYNGKYITKFKVVGWETITVTHEPKKSKQDQIKELLNKIIELL